MLSPFNTTGKLKITDDSGFLAIVNAETYNSFVDENWELIQLMNHFIDEMKSNTIIFWGTGLANEWTVSFVDKPSNNSAFREFTQTINVTNEQLYLTNYEDLTMSAQFEDTKIPAEHHADLAIQLENGLYYLKVRQMFDPEDDNNDLQGKVNFEIVIQKNPEKTESINKIYWWPA
jgi:hypothetical protein